MYSLEKLRSGSRAMIKIVEPANKLSVFFIFTLTSKFKGLIYRPLYFHSSMV
ncbi:UNVERIFIED_ORG: hypothetical protein M2402_005192 [Rahnella aquatilis]